MAFPAIQDPKELKELSLSSLEHLAQEIRQRIISVCLKNGGHLGASLGTVELAIALHRTFSSPQEPILWDVGHQAYAHKLLTGRWEAFETLRQDHGISGFPSPQESPHDPFVVGHSSTVLSVALAMAWAKRKKDSRSEDWTVAVVGDGGLTSGLSFEALNNFRNRETGRLLIVLNDNQFSISPSQGGVSWILSSGKAPEYFSFFGLDYVGPVDGHDLNQLLGTLGGIRSHYQDRPVLIHVITQKGRGYAPAEELPAHFHGVSPLVTAEEVKIPGKEESPTEQSFSHSFGEALCTLAEEDPRVLAITAAMPEGTGLGRFAARFPERFFDVGIAEPHAVTFAAGLAAAGYRPVVAIYSTFLQRAMDGVIHDVALQNLPVTLAIDRAGLVGNDGPTHHGVFDLAYFLSVPNFSVFAPACVEDLPSLLRKAIALNGPASFRYPRGGASLSLGEPPESGYRVIHAPKKPKAIVIAVGAATVAAKKAGLDFALVYSLHRMKPFPEDLLDELNQNENLPLLVVEPGIRRGGVGEAVLSALQPRSGKTAIAAIEDHFVRHGSVASLEEEEGLTPERIQKKVLSLL